MDNPSDYDTVDSMALTAIKCEKCSHIQPLIHPKDEKNLDVQGF